ncbi:MAG: M16 family metallopeptidase, partial [Chitinophagaceae bacterium]
YFLSWKKGIVPKPIYQAPKSAAKTYIAIVDKPTSVQSVINIVNPISLKPGALDEIPATVMSNVLGGGSTARLYNNLREKYGFTYGAYCRVASDRLVGNFTANAAVRNEKTDSAIGQFLFEFNRLRNEAILAEEVSRNKNEMSGAFARRLENPATIAEFALNVARYNLPKDYYQNYLQNLAAVDVNKVQEVAKKFVQVNNLHIVIVGNAKEIAKGLEKYGTVKYFDVDGNEVSAPVTKTVDASVTGKSILEKAAAAAASTSVMAAFKDLTLAGTASVMGQNLNYTQTYIAPDNYKTEFAMQGMSIMKQLAKAGEYSQVMQGQNIPLDDKDKEEMNTNSHYFTEAYMASKPDFVFTVK